MSMLPRGLQPTIERAWANSAVVVLEGLRATGKSTLAQAVVAEEQFRTLNASQERRRALEDPDGWLGSLPVGVVIDEAQLVPELQLGIKQLLDERGAAPGQFLLTGSARFNTRELGGSDPLTGRVQRFRLHPFTQSELDRRPADVISSLFDGDPATWQLPGCDHREIIERASRGGFPTMRGLDLRARSRMLDDYVPALFDGSTHATKRDIVRIARFFRWLAGRSGSVRNVADFASLNELARETVPAYLEELAQVHLIESVSGYRPGQDQRETERERLFVADPAFVAAGLPADPTKLMENTDAFCGLLETFVATEIIRLLTWSATDAKLFHWRESDAREVDLVLERRDGALIGIEVKAARSARSDHANGLRAFRQRYPKRFHRGFVLHSGAHATRLEDDLWALPFSALWMLGAQVGPPKSALLDRIRLQAKRIQAEDASELAAIETRAVRMDAAFERAVAVLVVLGDVLKELGLSVATSVKPSHRWTGTLPPNRTDRAWAQSAQLDVGTAKDPILRLDAFMLAGGEVNWTSNESDGERSIATEVSGDHDAAISQLLSPFVDRLAAVVAAHR
jgi:uncharacterized protein